MTGLAGLQAAANEQKAKAAAFDENSKNFVRYAKFLEGKTYVVRFLEQGDDVAWAWVHDLPKEMGQNYSKTTPCLNQDGRSSVCPGCEMGLKRKISGWINVLVRNAPVQEKNPLTNKYQDTGAFADQVMVWNSGSNLFTTLGNKDRSFKGLMSRDFEVIRSGQGLQTKYSIEPVDADSGPVEMSVADRELAKNKADTKKFATPESYEVAKQLMQGVPMAAIRAANEPAEAAASTNIFKQKLEEQHA